MKRAGLAGLIIAACGALALGGCGGADSATSGSSGVPVQSVEEAAERSKPEVSVPPTPPPEKLVVEDLIEGTGAEAQKGDEVAIKYVGLTWNGENYADSWRYDSPPRFVLGSGRLAPGFDHGIRGMKVGGRREVLVPITQIRTAETSRSSSVPLQPADTLVLVVDLVDLN